MEGDPSKREKSLDEYELSFRIKQSSKELSKDHAVSRLRELMADFRDGAQYKFFDIEEGSGKVEKKDSEE